MEVLVGEAVAVAVLVGVVVGVGLAVGEPVGVGLGVVDEIVKEREQASTGDGDGVVSWALG